MRSETHQIFESIHNDVQSGGILSVTELCQLAGVSRSGYYRWVNASESRKARENQDLLDFEKIKEAYSFRGYAKGYRGISMRLKRMGAPMNHKKVRRLMRKYGLLCPVRKANPYRRMAKALRTDVTAPNHVNREFFQHGPRKILLTDITYLKLNDGFCYLSVIIDAYTRQILAWRLSESLEVDFVLETVKDLLRVHGHTLKTDVLLHSDQGCHYTSTSFRELLKNRSLTQSMSRKGNCWDNAPQESFFGHMKDEIMPYIKEWHCFEDVFKRIEDWINYYNNDRYQAGLGELSPNEFYDSLQHTT